MRSRLASVSLFALTVATVRCGSAEPIPRPPNEIPPDHRPEAVACSATTDPYSDGGATACHTSADCTSAPWLQSHCLHGSCSQDSCLTDSDCGSSAVCACANGGAGNSPIHPNVCVASGNCRVDSDCGAGGFCMPSRGYCGIISGFYCRRPTDTCVDPMFDCPSGRGQACVYDQNLGHFACATVTCNG